MIDEKLGLAPRAFHEQRRQRLLIDLMLDWAPDEAVRNRIVVDSAAKLYDFSKS